MKDIHKILFNDISEANYKNTLPSHRKQTFNPNMWSAVSVCVFVEEYIFFIKRSEQMPSFKGHLAFFGGHKSDLDKTVIDAGLREYEEESHFSRDSVETLGILPPVFTVSDQFIVPVICRYQGTTKEFLKSVRSNGEWVFGMMVPFEHFLEKKNWSFAQAIQADREYPVYFNFIPRDICLMTHRVLEGQILWGATAKIMWSLLNLYHS